VQKRQKMTSTCSTVAAEKQKTTGFPQIKK
jgi:hypothetical protein